MSPKSVERGFHIPTRRNSDVTALHASMKKGGQGATAGTVSQGKKEENGHFPRIPTYIVLSACAPIINPFVQTPRPHCLISSLDGDDENETNSEESLSFWR